VRRAASPCGTQVQCVCLLSSCRYVGRVLSSHVACLWSVWVGVGSSTAGSRRGVKRGAPGLVSPSSVLFFSSTFFLSWRSWRRGGTVALLAVASAMRRIGVAFLCADCCWRTAALRRRLRFVLALCGGSFPPPCPSVLLWISIRGRRG
jgi:hypothetical protein